MNQILLTYYKRSAFISSWADSSVDLVFSALRSKWELQWGLVQFFQWFWSNNFNWSPYLHCNDDRWVALIASVFEKLHGHESWGKLSSCRMAVMGAEMLATFIPACLVFLWALIKTKKRGLLVGIINRCRSKIITYIVSKELLQLLPMKPGLGKYKKIYITIADIDQQARCISTYVLCSFLFFLTVFNDFLKKK